MATHSPTEIYYIQMCGWTSRHVNRNSCRWCWEQFWGPAGPAVDPRRRGVQTAGGPGGRAGGGQRPSQPSHHLRTLFLRWRFVMWIWWVLVLLCYLPCHISWCPDLHGDSWWQLFNGWPQPLYGWRAPWPQEPAYLLMPWRQLSLSTVSVLIYQNLYNPLWIRVHCP